jgi:Tfp pilus assembly protein FimT
MSKIFYQKACPLSRMVGSRRGITFIEVVIIIAIIGIISLIAIPRFLEIKNLQILKNASSDIVSSLSKARSETMGSLDSSSYGVHFQSDKIIIFRGTSFTDNDSENENINIITPATISDISLTGGVSDIYFNRLIGSPSVTGTITVSISGDASLTKTITISATGWGV